MSEQRLVRESGRAAAETPRSGEQPASAAGPEAPVPLRTERREDGSYEASFSLALESLVCDERAAPQAATYDAFILEHMFAVLEPGQQLSFVMRRDPRRRGVSSMALSVRGTASGGCAAGAASSALPLHAALRRLIAARTDCEFAPEAAEPELPAHAFEVEIGGQLLVTDARPKAREPEIQPVVVPALGLVEARVPFWEALLGCDFPVETQVSVGSTSLEGPALASLGHAWRSLKGQTLRCEMLPERAWLNPEQIERVRGHLETEISRWLALPRGVWIEIAFRTPEPVPPGALRWLAQALLPMRRLAIRPQGPAPRGRQLSPQTVDLRHCLNESQIMPALLPDRATVRRFGLPRRFAAPGFRLSETGLLLGSAGGREVRWLPQHRARHCYLVGATGCGKSSFLLNMIRQDIEAGEGLAVLDPHGDLYHAVRESIPARRAADVVLLDSTDCNRAVGLNYLAIPGANPSLERNFVANEMIGIFDRLYDLKQTGGPLFEQYMRNALLLLMDSGLSGMTLVEVPLIFEDDDFRGRLIESCTNASVARFWTRQAERAAGDHSLRNVGPYITSKLNQFTANALLRPIVGQSRSTIDMRRIMDGRGILLVNLAKGALGTLDSALLGMLVISKIYLSALARAKAPGRARPAFYVYLDEFQNFASETMAFLLSEARKFGVGCVVANQYLTQLAGDRRAFGLADAVLSNAATLLVMRAGAPDAEQLSCALGGRIAAHTLMELPDFHVAARLPLDGAGSAPFVFRTAAPTASPVDGLAQRTIRAKMNRYTRPVAEVEKEIELRASVEQAAGERA